MPFLVVTRYAPPVSSPPEHSQEEQHCVCGYLYVAHTKEGMARNVPSNRRTVVEEGRCT